MRVPTSRLALLGFLLLSPTLLFVGACLFKYILGLGFLFDRLEPLLSNPERKRTLDLLQPLVFLGGSGLAVGLNFRRLVHLSASLDAKQWSGTLTLERQPWNLVVMALGVLLVATLLGYLVSENWRCWAGLQTDC